MTKETKVEISSSEHSPEIPGGECLVLMPFGAWFDEYYQLIFKPAIVDSGLTPKRADDLYRPGTIVNDIWALTKSARVLIADLTGRNPNVFYELGLAHALAKPVILVADSIEQVPFDLRALRILEYNKENPEWGARLRVSIRNALNEVVVAPLQAVLPTFLQVTTEPEYAKVTEREKYFLEINKSVDLIGQEVRRLSVDIGDHSLIRALFKRGVSQETMMALGFSAEDIDEVGVGLYFHRQMLEDWVRDTQDSEEKS